MGKIICVANQKGGVGKTTTVVNLGASLATLGKRTLIVDFDPQANATSGLGIDKTEVRKTIYRAIIGELDLRETIVELAHPVFNSNLSLSPSNSDLSGAAVELADVDGREWRLRETLRPLKESYEFILIDCPPSLGLLTINALSASDSVLIPVQCEYYAMEGLGDLARTMALLTERLNPALRVEGYLLTMFDARNKLSHVVANELRGYFKRLVFDTVIPRNVRLAESPSHGLPALLYDQKSLGATSYLSLAEEILARNGGTTQ
jgi:chromosome partitioning protein